MSIINNTMEFINSRLEKGWIGIPQKYHKLKSYIPFWEPKTYILVSANSGVGKTRHVISDFIIEPYLYARRCDEVGMHNKVKILYFSLEVPYHAVVSLIISNLYYRNYKEEITKQDLFTKKQDDYVLDNIENLSKLYSDLEEKVTIVDTLRHPDEIMHYTRKWYKQYGEIKTSDEKRWFEPKPEYADTQFIIIVDTINVVNNPRKDTYSTIADFSLKDCKGELIMGYGATVVVVQQQNKAAERNTFTFKGSRVEEATKPSRNSLAECGRTFDDADIFYTLYSPHTYRISRYPFDGTDTYDVDILKDHLTLLLLEKN